MGGSAVAFIDPSDGGNNTSISIVKAYGQAVCAVGFTWKKSWNHCLDDIVPLCVNYGVKRICFETNKHGDQPVELMQQIPELKAAGIGVVGRHSSTNKHARIMAAGTFAHHIHLARESHKPYVDHVVRYEYQAKVDDPPDSLASCLEWIGLIKGKENKT